MRNVRAELEQIVESLRQGLERAEQVAKEYPGDELNAERWAARCGALSSRIEFAAQDLAALARYLPAKSCHWCLPSIACDNHRYTAEELAEMDAREEAERRERELTVPDPMWGDDIHREDIFDGMEE